MYVYIYIYIYLYMYLSLSLSLSLYVSIYLSINLPPRRPNHNDRCRGAMWTGSLFCQCIFSSISSIDDRS